MQYLAALFAALATFLLRWPIFAGDADLWYHLAAGRVIGTTGEIPRQAVGTFLERPWIDYSWLFQVVAWTVHRASGYFGLVLLRAVLFGALAAAVTALLRPWRRPGLPWRVGAFVAVLFVVLPRFASLRPQLVSLVLLAVCLLALERGGRWLYVLPVAAVVWANAHGVSWPVLAIVLAAHGVELAWQVVRGRAPADLRARTVAIAAAAAGVLVTPHGIALLRLPFTSLDFAAQTIDELAPLPAASLARLTIEGLVPSRQTWFNVVALLAIVALVQQVTQRRLRPAHLVLVAGAALLPLRGSRFVCEAAILALPLLAGWEPPPTPQPKARPVRLARAALLLVLGLVPFLTLARIRYPGRFPLSVDNLPTGVATFLACASDGGPIFGFPDLAGYLEWRLAPRFRVFADLQTPFPYTDLDTFLAVGASGDPLLLNRVLAQHRPDFLIFGVEDVGAPSHLDRRWGYVPVAFDWTTVLYARRDAKPQLVARYALRAVDPFAGVEAMVRPGAPPALARAELARLAALDPGNAAVAVALGRLDLAAADPVSALHRARVATTTTPVRPQGWQLAGESLLALGRSREAIAAFETARERGTSPARIGRQLWVCWSRLGEPRRAYRELRRAVDPLSGATTYLDLLALGETAAAVGDREAAERNLTFALWKAPDAESRRRVAAALARVRGE